ncbi:MAG: hypothetical protein M3O32_02765, partial [Actinomycetota bacterium]|nr:hypothetical protein [Actinomycetota bacterium]
QVGRGRAVSDVAAELNCDWHTINDAVTTYGEALLAADTKRLTLTTAIGLDETSFVKLRTQRSRQYATTVADVAHHQILEILHTRDFKDVARWVDSQPGSWKGKIAFGARGGRSAMRPRRSLGCGGVLRSDRVSAATCLDGGPVLLSRHDREFE